MRELGRALALDPNLVAARRQLALLLVAAGRWEENIAECREILRRAPDDWNTRYSLGQSLMRTGREEDGRRELAWAQEIRRREQARQELDRTLGRGVAALKEGKRRRGARELPLGPRPRRRFRRGAHVL